MNANIVKTQIFKKMKYDLKGSSRSEKTTFYPKIHFFFCFFFFFLIEEKNAAENYERARQHLPCTLTTFVLYKDDIGFCIIVCFVSKNANIS